MGDAGISPCAVVDRYIIPADGCQAILNEMELSNGWTDAAAGVLGMLNQYVGGAVIVQALLTQVSYSAMKTALKKGIASGKGCTMTVYDNAAPTFTANN